MAEPSELAESVKRKDGFFAEFIRLPNMLYFYSLPRIGISNIKFNCFLFIKYSK